jgi:hypothetical protein
MIRIQFAHLQGKTHGFRDAFPSIAVNSPRLGLYDRLHTLERAIVMRRLV